MRKSLILFSISFLIFGCSPFKKVLFKSDTFMSAGRVNEFEIAIPKRVQRYSSDLKQYLLKMYEYKDSSVLYISLDINFGHSPNRYNWMKCSVPKENFKCEEGQQDDGLYWKEILSNNLVVGYYNVNKTKKEMFDKALSTLNTRDN